MRNDAFSTDLTVRFRDLDTMGHVNNALYATYLEEARVDYYQAVLDASLPDVDTVLARLEIDFSAPIKPASPVTVLIDVPELGESSIPMEYEIHADGALAATAQTVQVMWNPEEDASRPIPDEWRRRIEAFEGL